MTGPFASALAYRARGWSGTLPLPQGQKGPPPAGFTGYDGQWPTDARVAEWQASGDHNLALRLPPIVIGLDVDAYGDKPGRATLAGLVARWGALPPTWTTTSREDGVSGIGLYRVPPEVQDWPTEAGPGIEIIRHSHRYAVVPPSLHPEGRPYRWLRPDGGVADGELPGLGDLPELPAAWLAGLTGHGAVGEHAKPGSRAEQRERGKLAHAWLKALPKGEPCRYVGELAVDLYAAARREDGSAYNHTLSTVLAVLRAGETGHPGVLAVLDRGRAMYVETVATDRGGAKVAEAEYVRLTVGGVVKILEQPNDRAGTGCDCEGVTLLVNGAPIGEMTLALEQVADPWPTPPAEAAYHGVLGELVAAVEDEVEPDPAGILGGLLAAFGALAGNARVLYQAGAQAPNLFVVLVGDSAISRKGTSYQLVRTIFELAGASLDPILVPGLGSGEGLVGHLQRRAADEQSRDNRALIVESEFGRLLRIINREGSTLSPILREAWDGVPLGRVLARDSKVVTDHHVGLYANTNRRELRAQLTETNGAEGLGNRFLWLAVHRTKLVPLPPRPDMLVRPHVADLALAIDFARRPGQVTMGADVTDHWTAWYATRAPRLGLLGVLTARAEAQVARLAMTYALADRSATIGAPHLAAAIAFWEFAERSAAYIFGESTGNRHADVLLRWLRAGDEYGWKEAKLALGLRTAADLEEVVELLTSADLAEVVERPRPDGGRPARIIRAKDAKGAKGAEPARKPEHENNAGT